MRGFTLSRGSYEKKDGIGRGSHTSPKIPLEVSLYTVAWRGTSRETCGLSKAVWGPQGPEGHGLMDAFVQLEESGLSRQPFLDLRASSRGGSPCTVVIHIASQGAR